MAPGLLEAIEAVSDDKPRFLVNTHWHGDHTGGNAKFTGAGATVIAHQGVRDRVTVDVTRPFFGQMNTTPASPPEAWPVITFDESMRLHLNGQTIHLIHVPAAHTDGDTFVVFEEANLIHTGDMLFSGMFPFVDISSGGTFDGYTAGLEKMLSMTDEETRIIPGHGPVSAPDALQASITMLEDTVAAVKSEFDAGKSLDETLEANPLGPWSEDWGWGFINAERLTALIYGDLERIKSEE